MGNIELARTLSPRLGADASVPSDRPEETTVRPSSPICTKIYPGGSEFITLMVAAAADTCAVPRTSLTCCSGVFSALITSATQDDGINNSDAKPLASLSRIQ